MTAIGSEQQSLSTSIVAHRANLTADFALAFESPIRFARDVEHVLYGPYPRLVSPSEPHPIPANVHLVRCALGEADRQEILHIAADSAANSLRPLNPLLKDFWADRIAAGLLNSVPFLVRHDGRIADIHRIEQEQAIDVRTLDGLLSAHQLPVSPDADVLSIDLPGTEWEALAGARRCLPGVLCVTTTASFIQEYRDQKLLGDLFTTLATTGLAFVGLGEIHEAAPRRLPLGMRGYDLPVRTRCVFLRRPQTLQAAGASADFVYVKAMKLAFTALTLGYIAVAVEALELARSIEPGPAIRAALRHRSYPYFLDEFSRVAATLPPGFLYERPDEAAAAISRPPEAFAQILPRRKNWLLRKAAGALRRLARAWVVLMGRMPIPYNEPGPIAVSQASGPTRTVVEEFLLANGFWSTSLRLSHRRDASQTFVIRPGS